MCLSGPGCRRRNANSCSGDCSHEACPVSQSNDSSPVPNDFNTVSQPIDTNLSLSGRRRHPRDLAPLLGRIYPPDAQVQTNWAPPTYTHSRPPNYDLLRDSHNQDQVPSRTPPEYGELGYNTVCTRPPPDYNQLEPTQRARTVGRAPSERAEAEAEAQLFRGQRKGTRQESAECEAFIARQRSTQAFEDSGERRLVQGLRQEPRVQGQGSEAREGTAEKKKGVVEKLIPEKLRKAWPGRKKSEGYQKVVEVEGGSPIRTPSNSVGEAERPATPTPYSATTLSSEAPLPEYLHQELPEICFLCRAKLCQHCFVKVSQAFAAKRERERHGPVSAHEAGRAGQNVTTSAGVVKGRGDSAVLQQPERRETVGARVSPRASTSALGQNERQTEQASGYERDTSNEAFPPFFNGSDDTVVEDHHLPF